MGGYTMTEQKKMSLKEAIQKQLEAKKNNTATNNVKGNAASSAKKCKVNKLKK